MDRDSAKEHDIQGVLEESADEIARLQRRLTKAEAEVERLRAEQDNAGFVPWRLAQDAIDELTAEVERLRMEEEA